LKPYKHTKIANRSLAFTKNILLILFKFLVFTAVILSVIKENLTNNVSYNQITTTKFNGLLMLGLGGDVRLYKQLYFTIDGGFRYGLTNLSNTSGIRTSPTYFSTDAGIKIKL
jgi:hypothetical protein